MEIFRNLQFQLIKYWILYLTVGMLFVFCSTSGICAAEDEELEISVLDEIEQGLINQSPGGEPQKTERKDLIKLEDKKIKRLLKENKNSEKSFLICKKKRQ